MLHHSSDDQCNMQHVYTSGKALINLLKVFNFLPVDHNIIAEMKILKILLHSTLMTPFRKIRHNLRIKSCLWCMLGALRVVLCAKKLN